VDSSGSGWELVPGSCEYGDELSGSGVTEVGSIIVVEKLYLLQSFTHPAEIMLVTAKKSQCYRL
jgi:hypothetical protein